MTVCSLAKLFLNPHLKYYKNDCEVECIRVLFFLLYSQHKPAKLEDNQPALEQAMQSQHESWEAQSCPLSNHHSAALYFRTDFHICIDSSYSFGL